LHFHRLTQFYWLTKNYQLSQAALLCFVPAMVRAAFGRTAEIAEMAWDDVRWDEHGQVVKVSWYEMKTSKSKAFAVAAGKTREDCVYQPKHAQRPDAFRLSEDLCWRYTAANVHERDERMSVFPAAHGPREHNSREWGQQGLGGG